MCKKGVAALVAVASLAPADAFVAARTADGCVECDHGVGAIGFGPKLSGNKKVSMIPQKDLEKTTGYVHGANNPIGIRQRHAFPIFIDQTALVAETMIVSAGEIGRSIRINSQELADFV